LEQPSKSDVGYGVRYKLNSENKTVLILDGEGRKVMKRSRIIHEQSTSLLLRQKRHNIQIHFQCIR